VVKPNQGSTVEFFPAVAVMQLGGAALQTAAIHQRATCV
jgi:hypothetical protein